jgi:hypothetical protein
VKVNVRKSHGFAGLRRLADQLRQIGDGTASREALEKFARYLRSRFGEEIARHKKGDGIMGLTFEVILDSDKRLRLKIMNYRRYVPRFSLKKGLPLSAVQYGQKLLKEALKERLKTS